MPLNDDPNAIPDDVYWAEWAEDVEKQKLAGEPACQSAPPQEVVDQVLADLDGDGVPG